VTHRGATSNAVLTHKPEAAIGNLEKALLKLKQIHAMRRTGCEDSQQAPTRLLSHTQRRREPGNIRSWEILGVENPVRDIKRVWHAVVGW
jgi:hypothetical protein